MRLDLLAFGVVFIACSAARAEAPSNAAFAAALSAQPSVTIKHSEERGLAVTEWQKNGVFYRREQNVSHDTFFGDDESGRGAVMCSWMIFEALRGALADCPSDRFVDLRSDLDHSIGAMEDFIVTNSVMPTTILELRPRAATENSRSRADLFSKDRTCAAGDTAAMIASFDAMGRPARLDMVRNLLSVPRWPVSNPCL